MACAFYIFQESPSSWRWVLQNQKGAVFAQSPHGYASAEECEEMLEVVISNASRCPKVAMSAGWSPGDKMPCDR